MERNVALYPAYQAARGLLFWLPVFFLYFASVLPAAQVLVLEAIYYAGVVVLEVPSGYLSDRLGRRPTLVIAMTAWVAAYLLFALTDSFVPFVIAQLLLAAGMAFNSGTDSALLYDSLAGLGRADEFGQREGRALGLGFLATALAAGIGGLVAGFDLRLAYALSAVGASVALVITWLFEEPAREAVAHAPIEQLRAVVVHLRHPLLAWVFAFAVAMTVFNHIPYELFQPYLGFLFSDARGLVSTPVVAGLTAMVMMGISALVSGRAMTLQVRLSTPGVLLGAMLVQGTIIAAMAAVVHPLVIGLLILRSVPQALMNPVIGAAVHPRLPSNIRATYFSVQSLAGRLAFSFTLLVAAAAVGDLHTLTHERMASLLWSAVVGLLVIAAILLVVRRAMRTAEAGIDRP